MHLNAYYFRQHMYTLVPHHLREDLRWMADIGTRAVSIGVLEQDLFASMANLRIIRRETERLGLELHAVPSRWGGLVAGSPKVPSLFSVQNPDTWILNADGSPRRSSVSGVISSVHHEATKAFVRDSLRQLFDIAPFDGVIWDEPKVLHVADHSEAAKRAMGDPFSMAQQHRAVAAFFDEMGATVEELSPTCRRSLFVYAYIDTETATTLASINHLDDFGCDGRPWAKSDGGGDDSDALNPAAKCLIDDGPRMIKLAKNAGKRSLMLIENHSLPSRDIPLMETRLPEIVAMKPDHLIYYYFPRNVDEPEKSMDVIRQTFHAEAERTGTYRGDRNSN